jgi:hypothetical protein
MVAMLAILARSDKFGSSSSGGSALCQRHRLASQTWSSSVPSAVPHVDVTPVTVVVRKCANIGWWLDVAQGKSAKESPPKMARPSGWKWLRLKCSCGRVQVIQLQLHMDI